MGNAFTVTTLLLDTAVQELPLVVKVSVIEAGAVAEAV
jgi:hypothetical protein